MVAEVKPRQITPEHQAILDRILPRMEEEKARLKQRQASGEKWDDLAADKQWNETRDSAEVVVNGKVRLGYGSDGVDQVLDLDPKKDIRMARLIDKAFALKDEYGGKNKDQQIFNELMQEMRNEFGKYNQTISKNDDEVIRLTEKRNSTKNKAEKEKLNDQIVALQEKDRDYYNSRGRSPDGVHYEIQNFPKDSLVCREYAAVASMALHYGGIENYNSTGYVTCENSKDTGRHAYIVSKKSGNVLNVTAIGSDIAVEHCYARVVNKGADFKKGETLVALEADGTYSAYGTGSVGKDFSRDMDKLEQYDRKLIKKAQNGDFSQAVAQNNTPANPAPKLEEKEKESPQKVTASAVKKELAEYKLKDGAFVDPEGRKVKLTGEGNGKGYHFHDLGCSLVPQGGDKFTIFYADKSIKHEKIEIHPEKEKSSGKGAGIHQYVAEEIKSNWQYKDGKFVSNEGQQILASGKGDKTAYHFHDMKCSLVPQGDGRFSIFVKDEETGKAKFQGKIELEVKGSSPKGKTAMLEEAAKVMQPLAEYNKEPVKSYMPQIVADSGISRGSSGHQV